MGRGCAHHRRLRREASGGQNGLTLSTRCRPCIKYQICSHLPDDDCCGLTQAPVKTNSTEEREQTTISPLLPSYLNASAIPCGCFSLLFKKFGSKGNQARTQKQQKSNENAKISLHFCCFRVLAGLRLDSKILKCDEKSPHGMADAFK